jgi:hypothetical protein
MPEGTLELTKVPSVKVGMLIRRSPPRSSRPRVRFTWSAYTPDNPTTVEFRFIPMPDDATYVQVTESGFTGTGDELAGYVTDSTGGFTFLISSLKALLEHDMVLGATDRACPSSGRCCHTSLRCPAQGRDRTADPPSRR